MTISTASSSSVSDPNRNISKSSPKISSSITRISIAMAFAFSGMQHICARPMPQAAA